MLTDDALAVLAQRLGLSAPARALLATIRSAPPSRRVRARAGNVTVRYPSRKMGVSIQAESHRNELAGLYEYEHDPQTLAFYDQPPPIKLVYPAKNGREVGVWHTPDFFVIHQDAVGWEEWKTEADLLRLAETMPSRYCRAEDGRWRCPPGERHAASFGFFYRVRSSAEIDWVFQRNLLFLEDYLRADRPVVAAEAATAIPALVAASPGLSLRALLGQVGPAHSDDVYALIATQGLYVDLRAAALAEPDRVAVFRDADTARAYVVAGAAAVPAPGGRPEVVLATGVPLLWDGRPWTIINPGESAITLRADDGTLIELPAPTLDALIRQGKVTGLGAPAPGGMSSEARERLARASPADFREANRRYGLIAPRLVGNAPVAGTTPARTVRLWVARWREAEQIHHCGYVGLLPRTGQSGNRTRKLPEATLSLLDAFIATDYETLQQKSRFAVYGALVRACEEQGVVAPSYKTFARAVRGRPRPEQERKRRGARAAAQVAPFYWELALTTPRHGDRPFEIGHLDHTQLDVELVCSRTGHPLGRPWATFLTDAFSRRVLALALSFDPPSYRACMLALRACVQRHHRLPQTLVVDGGREFAGTYFETLLARYECTKKTRPGGQPRFGAVCERLFGTTNTRFVHTLVGNTQITQAVRQMTRAVDPQEQARWTLGRLFARLGEWAYEVYDTLEHPALGQSPREAFAAGLAQGGQRPHRRIPDDDDFRMFTLPTTRTGVATVHPRLGVKIAYASYWSDAFRDPAVEQTAVPVRFDPFDAGVAYAYVRGRWVRCISEHYARFAGHSQREIQLATAELRRRHQQHAGRLTLTARKLADFLASLAAEEVLLAQRLRDAEARAMIAPGAAERAGADGPASGERAHPGATPAAARGAAEDEALVVYADY